MTRLSMFPLLCVTALAASPTHAAQCYSMFDAKNTRVYQTATAPIDLSRPISGEMSKRFPARYLVISDAGSCPEIGAGSSTTGSLSASIIDDADYGGTSPSVVARTAVDPAPRKRVGRGPIFRR